MQIKDYLSADNNLFHIVAKIMCRLCWLDFKHLRAQYIKEHTSDNYNDGDDDKNDSDYFCHYYDGHLHNQLLHNTNIFYSLLITFMQCRRDAT